MNESKEVTKAALQSLFGEEDVDSDEDDNSSGVDQSISCNGRTENKTESMSLSYTYTTRDKNKDEDQAEEDALATTRKRKSAFQHLEPQAQEKNPNKNITINREESCDWDQKIGIFDGLLTPDECDELIAVHSSEAHVGYIEHKEVTRIMDLVQGADTFSLPLTLPLLRARYKTWETIETFYPDAALEVFPSFTALSAWRAGSFLRWHYDSNREYLRERDYSAILYLNDPCDNHSANPSRSGEDSKPASHKDNYHHNGFSGGDLVFEVPSSLNNQVTNKEERARKTVKRVRPKAGRLVCFPSSSDYVHAVERVTKGSRYAVTMWFTKDQQFAERFDSLQWAFYSIPDFRQFKSETIQKATAILPSQLFPQPWETPTQATALRLRKLKRAGLPKPPLPNGNCETKHNSGTKSLIMTQKELLYLIAHCWWKRGVPLGDLLVSATIQQEIEESETMTSTKDETTKNRKNNEHDQTWILEGGKEFASLLGDWKTKYLAGRSKGLASALDRWMNREGGLISSVRDAEMA